MTMLDIFRGLKGLTKSQSVGRSSLWKRGLRESFSGHDRQLNISTALLSNSHLPPRILPHSHHSTVSCSKYEVKRTSYNLFSGTSEILQTAFTQKTSQKMSSTPTVGFTPHTPFQGRYVIAHIHTMCAIASLHYNLSKKVHCNAFVSNGNANETLDPVQ